VRRNSIACDAARSERIAPQIVAIQFNENEDVEKGTRVVVSIPDAVEARDPVSPRATASPPSMSELGELAKVTHLYARR
jgi:hypothetical protein